MHKTKLDITKWRAIKKGYLLKDSLVKINMADIGKEAKLPPPSFASPPQRDWWR